MKDRSTFLLVVDDEVDSCRNLVDIFTDLGYCVGMAHDGPSALAKLQQQRYDIILLDLMMPGMDGLAVYQEIKRWCPEAVVILTTAYPNHPRAEESLKVGVWRIAPKPVDPAQLVKLLEEALDLPLVLVVDDDVALCQTLRDLFWERGFRVGIAHDIQTANERLRDSVVRVVLVDLHLPDGNGLELLRSVRQIASPARTVVITGQKTGPGASWEQLRQEGGDAICYKPFNLDELLATVGRLSRD
jgi:DNA-binding NtrC family response regulator